MGAAGRPVRAARLLNRALALLTDTAGTRADDERAVHVRVLASLAYVEAELGHVDRGLQLVDEGARLAIGLADQAVHGLLHLQRGSILVRRGAFADALANLGRAVRLLDGDPEYQCITLLNRGALHLYWGNLAAARDDSRECHAIASREGLDVLRAKARGNLGHLAFLRGDLPAALRDIDAALSDPALQASAHRSVFMGSRAEVLRAAGLTREADADLAEAAEIFRRERLTHDLAEALLARSHVALLERRWADARRHAAAARRWFTSRGNTTLADLATLTTLQARLEQRRRLDEVAAEAGALADRLRHAGLAEDARVASLVAARAALARGDVPRATAIVGTATRLTDHDRIGTRLLVRLVRAEIAGAHGRRADREAELRRGLAEVHRYQSRFGSLDLQAASALHGRRLAELGLADAVRDGSPDVVFAWTERARALTARLPAVRPPDDPRAAELLADLRSARGTLRAAELAGQRPVDLRRRCALLERQVRAQAWFAAGPSDVEQPVSLPAVRAAVGGSDGCLVSYLTVGDTLHALVVRASTATLVPLGAYDDAQRPLQRVRADLDAAALTIVPAPVRVVVLRSLVAGLRRVEAALWTPLRRLVGDGPVAVVPTASLGAVPWSLLPSLRRRPVIVVPSATSWLAARERSARHGGPVVFAVGPGVPRGEAEVRAAAAAWGDASIVLTGAAATSAAVLPAAADARLLHVAAHGAHEPDNPLFSSIQLADGPLFGHDLPRAAALPPHVVLSACDLGLAEVRPGDEALGMTSALLHSGVASVVAGVARVGDEIASVAMAGYHRRLAAGASPAEALAGAAIDPDQPAPLVCFGAGW